MLCGFLFCNHKDWFSKLHLCIYFQVAYVTVVSPYILLFILLIRVATLPGAKDGINFFILPRWESLKNTNVSVSATRQKSVTKLR